MTRLQHPWGPEYSQDSKLLILGTFPSPASRQMGFCYGHPQNSFWQALASSLGLPEPPYDVEARRRFARDNGIALWDVFSSVEIAGAADASIRDPIANSFADIIQSSAISAVFTTGRKATEAFNTLCSREAGMRAIYLPSTSPANRRIQATAEYHERWLLVGQLLRGELVSAAGMRERDRRTIADKHVPSLVLMERAALAVVDVVMRQYGKTKGDVPCVCVCVCGPGNNGGDGIAVARLLHNAGVPAQILFVGNRDKMSPETRQQALIASSYGVPCVENDLSPIATSPLIIDALFGIGLMRDLAGIFLEAVQAINTARASATSDVHVVAVDIPSGLQADTGEVLKAAVRADTTVTFACNKVGLTISEGPRHAGHVHIADIGIY